MTATENLLLVVAVLLGAFGIFMIAGVCIGVLEGTSNYSLTTDVMLTGVFGLLPIGGGLVLYRHVKSAAARRHVEAQEKIVLHLAQQHQGILTVLDVAANSSLSVEQARATLDQLNIKGFNEMDVSDTAVIVYKFHL